MPYLKEARSSRWIGSISDEDAQLLGGMLENKGGQDVSYWIDSGFVETLASQGASPNLLENLRTAIGSRDGVDIVFSEPLRHAPLGRPRKSSRSVAHSDAEASAYDEAEIHEDAEPHADNAEVSTGTEPPRSSVSIELSEFMHGRDRLYCALCHNTDFIHRRVIVHTGRPYVDVSKFREEVADCRVCSDCGHAHFFLNRDSD